MKWPLKLHKGHKTYNSEEFSKQVFYKDLLLDRNWIQDFG